MMLVQLLFPLLRLFNPLFRLLLCDKVLNLDVPLQLIHTLHLLFQVLIHDQCSHFLCQLLRCVCYVVSLLQNVLVFPFKDLDLLCQTKLTKICFQLVLHFDHFVSDLFLVVCIA